MALGRLILPAADPVVNANGSPVAGATLTVYANRTLNLATIYTDQPGVTPAANPQSGVNASNANGYFYAQSRSLWADSGLLYTVKLVLPGGQTYTYDDIAVSTSDSLSNAAFLQAGTAAVTRTAQGKMREHVSSADYAASADTDLSPSIAKALDYFGYAGEVVVVGGEVSETVVIQKAIALKGRGVGSSTKPTDDDAQALGWLRADAMTGESLVKIMNTFGASVENLRLIGDSAAKPLCAVEVTQDLTVPSPQTQMFSKLSQLWIGELYTLDSDGSGVRAFPDFTQFQNGIIYGPAAGVNNDTNLLQFIRIAGCSDAGIDFRSANASDSHLDTINIQNVNVGLRTKACLLLNNVFIHAKDTMFEIGVAGKIHGNEVRSEGTPRIARFTGDAAKLSLIAGAWQAQNGVLIDDRTAGEIAGSVPAYCKVIDAATYGQLVIDLQDFSLQVSEVLTGPIPVFRVNKPSVSNTFFRMMGTWGIWPENFDLGTPVSQNDPARQVIYFPAPMSGQDPMPRDMQTLDYDVVADRAYRAFRNDFLGEVNVRGGPFQVRSRLPPIAVGATALLGTGATAHNYKWAGITYDGGTTVLSALATVNNAATLDSTHVNRVTANVPPGCYGAKLYKDVAGTYTLLATVTWASVHSNNKSTDGLLRFDDDGSVVPAGAAPTANTTGNALVEGKTATGTLSVGGGTVLTKAVAYAPNITPAAVAANISAEQTFTVAGLTTADKVIVNGPAPTAGTGIVNVRVSAADTLAITWGNFTAGALTPPAGVHNVLAVRS